jgi:hypothetical protein
MYYVKTQVKLSLYHALKVHPVLKHHAMKAYGGIGVWLYMLILSALDWG